MISLAMAVLGLIVSIILAQWASKRQRDQHLDSAWRGIMGLVDQNPDFSDISKCNHYLSEFDWHTRLRYDAFCMQAWSACYAMATSIWPLSNSQRLVVDWMATYHDEWLKGNSHLFTNRRFWKLIGAIRSEELRLTVHRPVPADGGLASWSQLMPRYFETFLSPYDPSIPAERRFDTIARKFLAEFDEPPVALDLGCRVGSLFPVLSEATATFYGLDPNGQVLDVAAENSGESGVVQSSVSSVALKDEAFDCVVAVNSILLNSRPENRQAFSEIARLLKPGGRALLLLPAYETMQHLRSLRVARWDKDQDQMERVATSFDYLRQMNDDDASYKDDGVTRQYFHSLETIHQELSETGLAMTVEPSKFYYPWELTRSYNYGFFPGKEETWDWIVYLEKSTT